jgi:hypothetical protein
MAPAMALGETIVLRRLALIVAAALLSTAGAARAEVTPERACAALAGEGLVMGPWTTGDDAFGQGVTVRNFRCLSEPLALPGGEGRFVTSINYYVEGRLHTRVETVRLVLNVHRAKTRAAGLKRFVALAEALFANLGLAPPAELAAALPEAKPGSWRSAYGTVRFEVWKSPIERLRLTLDLAPPRPGA